MDRQNIIQLFLNMGTQIDKEALDFLSTNQEKLDYILQLGKDKLPPIITSDFMESLPNNERKNIISVDKLSEILTSRYEFVKSLLLDKEELNDLVSINKINEKIKQFSVIGVVFEKEEGRLILEDQTGQDMFVAEIESIKYVVEDDVIGLSCTREDGQNQIKKVVYPDIRLRREPNKTEKEENCIFIHGLHPDNKNEIYKNFYDWLGKQKTLKIISLYNKYKYQSNIPENIVLYEQTGDISEIKIDNINILLFNGDILEPYTKLWSTTLEETVINLLKKRNLNPIFDPISYNNDFLLKNTPDVIALVNVETPFSINYKGITILAGGSFSYNPIFWSINLRTRETFKISFS